MWLTNNQLNLIGFKSFGNKVLISDKASIYNPANISIGDNVRIDDFVIISAGVGGIDIGSNIHIACHSSFIGAGKITLGNYSNYAAYTCILSSSDDFSGEHLISPVLPDGLRKVKTFPVTVKDFAVLGVRTVILPGVTMGRNAGTGVGTLVKKDIPDNELWAGCPAEYKFQRAENKFGITDPDWAECYLEYLDE